jgi:hypothetical protein
MYFGRKKFDGIGSWIQVDLKHPVDDFKLFQNFVKAYISCNKEVNLFKAAMQCYKILTKLGMET